VSPASRTPDQITAEIAETRERLATTIDTLVYRAAPKTILRRQMESVKARFVTSEGSPDLQMIGKVAGGVLGFVVLVVVIRKVTG
jgi:predicted transcriptional regulator